VAPSARFRARVAAGLLIAAVLAWTGSGAVARAAPPAIRAPEALAVDAASGAVLYAKHPDRRRAMASTTKLMTALVALQSTRPEQEFAAVPYSPQSDESTLGLAAGERMTVHDLLRALLLPSAGDAAATIARGVAGTRAAFVDRMNAEARRLGLSGTSYANPVGLDDPDNYSTARDLVTLARRLLRDPTFAAIVDLPRARLESGAHPRVVLNRNQLVRSYPFVDGVKTGHTRQAGYVLVGAARGRGAQVVSAVLGEPSEAARNADTLVLLRYGLSRFERVRAVPAARTQSLVPVNYFDGVHVPLRAARDITVTARRGARVHTYVRLPFPVHLTGPLRTGATVGRVTVTVDGRTAGSAPLVTGQAVPRASFWRRTALEAGHTNPTLALGYIGVALLAALRLRGLVLRRFRGRARP
jgi:D-alanyl-D-alanine carboxypeptidase (penicillin-binding protein 5/6)